MRITRLTTAVIEGNFDRAPSGWLHFCAREAPDLESF